MQKLIPAKNLEMLDLQLYNFNMLITQSTTEAVVLAPVKAAWKFGADDMAYRSSLGKSERNLLKWSQEKLSVS